MTERMQKKTPAGNDVVEFLAYRIRNADDEEVYLFNLDGAFQLAGPTAFPDERKTALEAMQMADAYLWKPTPKSDAAATVAESKGFFTENFENGGVIQVDDADAADPKDLLP